MKLTKKNVEGIFIKRPNRFQAYVELEGETVLCHVPNTGRLKEILVPGVRCLIRLEDNPARKTQHSLIGAWKDGFLINFDSQVPNHVVEEALKNGWIDDLKEYTIVEREKKYGISRFDFRLSDDGGRVYFLEVKGVTLEFDGVVSFPDAVTERGARHLMELCQAKADGFGAGVIFLIQMEKAEYFRPYYERDPAFAKALKDAQDCGVDIFTYLCETDTQTLTLKEAIPHYICESDLELHELMKAEGRK